MGNEDRQESLPVAVATFRVVALGNTGALTKIVSAVTSYYHKVQRVAAP